MTEHQLRIKEKCENLNIGTFDYYQLLYILIKPILPPGFKAKYTIDIESVILAGFNALDLQNKEWWAEKKLQIFSHLKGSKYQYLKDMLTEGGNESSGNFGVILQLLPKYISQSQNQDLGVSIVMDMEGSG